MRSIQARTQTLMADKAAGLRYAVFDGFRVSVAVGRGKDRSFGQIGMAWAFGS